MTTTTKSNQKLFPLTPPRGKPVMRMFWSKPYKYKNGNCTISEQHLIKIVYAKRPKTKGDKGN